MRGLLKADAPCQEDGFRCGRLRLGARSSEVREQELSGAGQGGLAFVEYRGEPLEDVRNAGCDLEGARDLDG
jgi:hypothetical protein